MNRHSGQWAAQNTTSLACAPTHPILLQMLKFAEKSIGQPYTINWPDHEKPMFLEVLVIEHAMRSASAGRKESGETPVRWTHGEYAKGEHVKAERKTHWTHETRDIGLISELLVNSFSPRDPIVAATGHDLPSISPLTNPSHAKRTGRFNALKFTKNALPATIITKKTGDVTLSGELNKVELIGILQSINICKMTGRLDLQDAADGIEIYFADGLAVHACRMNVLNTIDDKPLIGDQVLLNALIWNSGSFCFNPERKTSERTIKRKLEVLLLEGACLKDYSTYLQSAQIDDEAILHQKLGPVSEEILLEKLSAGMPMDTRLQKSLYDSFDGRKRLGTIIANLGLQKPSWIPAIFNLLTCNLISVDENDAPEKKVDHGEIVIDSSQIAKAERDLARYETGFLSFPLLMLFLQSEVDRYIDSGTPLALVLFEIWHKNEAVSNEKLQKIAGCFRSIAASYDLIGHYKDFEFAMLLPLKEESDTREFIDIFQKFVSDSFGDDGDSIKLSCGIATAEGFDINDFSLQKFVTAAVKAKRAAKQRGTTYTSARQLGWEEMKKQAETLAKGSTPESANKVWQKLYEEAAYLQFDRTYWATAAETHAANLIAARKFGEAEGIISQLIKLKSDQFGVDDVSTITTAGDLAHCYYAQGKYGEAESLIQGVLRAFFKHYGEYNAIVGTWCYNLATLYHVQHKYVLAEPMYERSLKIRKKVLGDNHVDTKKAQSGYDVILSVIYPEPVPELENIGLQSQGQLITGSWTVFEPDKNESVF